MQPKLPLGGCYFSIAVRVGMAALGLCESSMVVAARLPRA